MDQRMKFIAEVLREEEPFAAICRRYGVSRQAGYKWVARYLESGPNGFLDRSRAAHSHPNGTPQRVVELLLQTRREHPTWGPRKLLAILERQYPGLDLPAVSTAGEVLRRHGLTVPRRRSRAGLTPPSHLGSQAAVNDTWAIDFKGQFRTGDGRYCYPLTLQDAASRYLLRLQGFLRPTTENIRPTLDSAFREFGLPVAIRSDNGAPFAGTGFTGLSRLAVWWLQLGIRLDRTEPASPQQNGRLERLHRTLELEECARPRSNLDAQQSAFVAWRRTYNEERPHEALGMAAPAEAYTRSTRSYAGRIEPPAYDGMITRTVQSNGCTGFAGRTLNLTTALEGLDIGFRETADGTWTVHFHDHVLGTLDVRTGILTNGRAHRACRDANDKPSRRRGQAYGR